MQATFQDQQFGENAANFVVKRLVAVQDGLLREVTDGCPFGSDDIPEIWLEISGYQAKEGRLAGAIDPNETNGFPFANLYGDAVEHHVGTELLGYVVNTNGGHDTVIIGESGVVTIDSAGKARLLSCELIDLRLASTV
jgi:hypothetical protein